MKIEFEQRLVVEMIKSKKETQDLLEKLQKESQSQKQEKETLLKEKEILKLKEEEITKAARNLEEEKIR